MNKFFTMRNEVSYNNINTVKARYSEPRYSEQ